jgi:hypothetical protein
VADESQFPGKQQKAPDRFHPGPRLMQMAGTGHAGRLKIWGCLNSRRNEVAGNQMQHILVKINRRRKGHVFALTAYRPPTAPCAIVKSWRAPAMLVQTDARRRITLPPSLGIQPGDAIDLEILEDGRIMLIPVEAVPKHPLDNGS